MTVKVDHLTKFNWQPQPATQRVVDSLVDDALRRCPHAADLACRMKDETGTRFKDWVDHVRVPGTPENRAKVMEVGFTSRPVDGEPNNFVCDLGIFPAIILDPAAKTTTVAIKVDSVSDFLAVHNLSKSAIHGEPFSQLRFATAFEGAPGDAGASMMVIERHGWRGHTPLPSNPAKQAASIKHLEALCRRERFNPTDAAGFAEINRLVDASIADLGRDWTCDVFFEAERRYWMRRNRAAQVQYARQNKLGLGWANHDHHTYRCSRHTFTALVTLWEKLGFHCREAFYAGAEAGWGAQVLEAPVTGITTFNDVDMSPEELLGDFSHKGFTERRDTLGTVGLWCALHGEALLQAGMHHLECQFDWHALVEQLEKSANVKTMAPFTTFPYLRQAFTEGERWTIDPKRIDAILADGSITREQADLFRASGALGSHMENLERNDGFKGFNQQGVSDIIARTDPRRVAALGR